jgi:hypothetical protein
LAAVTSGEQAVAPRTSEVVKMEIGCNVCGKPNSPDRRTEIFRRVVAKQIDNGKTQQHGWKK